MWTAFVKALRHSATSLEAVVTNTAANFFVSVSFLIHVHEFGLGQYRAKNDSFQWTL